MFTGLFKRTRTHEVPQQLYGSVVAQSREPVLFTDYGFPDTVTGRFDAVSLHLFLFSRRLVREDTTLAKSLNQEVFDYFTDDTDRALRELGVGDTSVPKRKKKMIHTFYAVVEDLSEEIDNKDEEQLLKKLETRFISSEGENAAYNHPALAKYILSVANILDEIPADQIMKGEIRWPSPSNFL
ncbi:MAG: ubiquinol-cytochrome C chaperone family protein [Salaquimonas sp.]